MTAVQHSSSVQFAAQTTDAGLSLMLFAWSEQLKAVGVPVVAFTLAHVRCGGGGGSGTPGSAAE